MTSLRPFFSPTDKRAYRTAGTKSVILEYLLGVATDEKHHLHRTSSSYIGKLLRVGDDGSVQAKQWLPKRTILGIFLLLVGAFWYSVVVDFESFAGDLTYYPPHVAIIGSICFGLPAVSATVFIGSIVRLVTKSAIWAAIVVMLCGWVFSVGMIEQGEIVWRVWLSGIILVSFSLLVIHFFWGSTRETKNR